MKEKRFKKVVEWKDKDYSKGISFFLYIFTTISMFLIGLIAGWLIITIWWIKHLIKIYKGDNYVYWVEIKGGEE